MVNKASIKVKEVQFHNQLTSDCGINNEIEWIDKGILEEERPLHNTFSQSFPLLVHMNRMVFH
jgi:hypothetical protein